MQLKIPILFLAAWLTAPSSPSQGIGPIERDLRSLGRFSVWTRIEIPLTGPESRGRGQPNPFEILADVVFTGPSGKKFKVPAFYDGDGRGGLDGDVWKVRFSADETGAWTFVSTSANRHLDAYKGSFTVTPPAPDAPDFYRWGRLERVGTAANKIRYLKFRSGPYWLKAGCDDPENFLGNYRHYDTLEKRKDAVDYLAGKGVNSMYIMTHNLDGDDKDVWPWLGTTAEEAKDNSMKSARFDIAKLEEWRRLFEFMQLKGIVPYIVLEDDSAWAGYDHARYYREMVARFGYLPALLFNFNEEHNENYSLAEALSFMQQLKEIDPYGHPRGIHNVNDPVDDYVDASQVDLTSIQTNVGGPLTHNQLAIEWINRCKSRSRRVLVISFDEGRPEEERGEWWSAYMGGGVWEVHVRPPYDRPMSTWDSVWTQLGGTRTFMESVPFWRMEPRNDLVKSGPAFCLARPGEVYALYLPYGGEITVELAANRTYEYAWWKAANGKDGRFENQGSASGGRQTFIVPGSGDWALRIAKR